MLRNKALAAVILVAACGLGYLWRLSTTGERRALASRAEVADGSEAPAATLAEAPPSPERDEPGPARERATLAVPPAPPEPGDDGSFEGDAVYGRLVAPGGDPVAEAHVLLFGGERGGLRGQTAPLAEDETSADGRYRFHDLDPFRSYLVLADADGFLPSTIRSGTGHDEETELSRCLAISGRVLDARDGRALPGVEVRNDVQFWSEDGYQEFVATTSDAEGRYTLPWARLEGMQRVRVRRPGYAYEQREFQVDADRSDGYDLRLGDGTAVVLEVYDLDSGAPVPDTEFELVRGHTERTDAAGRIDLESVLAATARDRRVGLSLVAPGWCRTNVNFVLPEDGTALTVRVPVTQGAAIHGRVTGTAEEPVPGAMIRFGGNRGFGAFRGRGTRRPDLPPNVWISNNGEPVYTGDDGRFEVTGLFPGPDPVQVYADHPDYARAVREDVQLPGAGAVVEVDLVLSHGAVLRGTVTVDGEPVSTNVAWNADDGSGWTRSDDHGGYRFRGVAPGEVNLVATLDDRTWSNHESKPETVWVEDGQELVHDIVIVDDRAPIAGRVVDGSGEPVPEAEVIAWASAEDFHFSTSTQSEADGTFELLVQAVPGVLYQIYAHEGPRHESREEIAPGTTGLELVLPVMGELRLEVTDALNGDPVEGFALYFRSSEAEPYQGLEQGGSSFSPGPDGTFVAALPLGRVDLVVGAKDQGYPAVEVPAVDVEPVASTRPVRVQLERGVTVEVSFDYAEGTRQILGPWMRRRRLTLVSEEQRAQQKLGGQYFDREVAYGQSLRVNDSGLATVRGLAPGEYGFLRAPDGVKLLPETFEVPLVDRHEVQIRVVRAEDEKENR